jgi:5-methylcytosine-specific restriction protein A
VEGKGSLSSEKGLRAKPRVSKRSAQGRANPEAGKIAHNLAKAPSPSAKEIAALLADQHVRADEVQLAAMEGLHYVAEAKFRRRNRTLIEEKKRRSNGKCSVCEFDFKATYKGLNRDLLVGHHVAPIGKRKKATKTTLDQIDILCPNCHAAVHSEDPPLSAD